MAIDVSVLTSQQRAAVTHGSGPVMLVAGAGTGKTTVITNRIAWLIANGKAKPEQILAVTFTEKAALEMQERVDRLLPLGYSDLWIHTFHAFCQRVLTDHAIDIGLPHQFKVIDTTGAWLMVRQHLDRFVLDYYKPLSNPTKFIHALLQHFSRCKDEGVYPDDYRRYAEELHLDTDQARDKDPATSESARIGEIASAYHVYQQLLLERGMLDFGDLINYTVKLFRERPAIAKQYQDRFAYVLVDEFQDTNWAQYELMKMVAAPRNNLMVVGDDDQSIYKFRGASFSNIVTFKKDFPDAKELFLTDNFRSGQKILDTAYQFIQLNNPDRLEVKLSSGSTTLSKRLTSHTPFEGSVSLHHFATAEDEVRGVLETIKNLKETTTDFSWNDVAILVRANEQAQRFVRTFRSIRIPHQFMAARGLYTQDIIIMVLSYLRLLDNYHESDAVYHILSVSVWGLEHEDLVHLNHLASRKSWSLWHTLTHYHGEVELKPGSIKAINAFTALVAKHSSLGKTLAPSILVYRFLEESGYLRLLTLEESEQTREQLNYLNQFYKKVRVWEEENLGGGMKQFVDAINLELESGESGTLDQDIEAGPEQIAISTIHSAKGLEYRYVFIVGVIHLRFPSRERKDPIEIPASLIKDVLPEGDAHLQEERRLMYVALTRAKERVYLTYADDYGTTTVRKPSRFLEELGFPVNQAVLPVNSDVVLQVSTELGPRPISYRLPSRFSYTQLKAFETCPKQYYYAHVIRIPAAGRGTFSFGKVMHATLEQFFTTVRERANAPQGTLFGDAEASKGPIVSESELIALYEKIWSEDWYFDEDNKRQYYEKGRSILRSFYERMGGAIPVPVALEQPFTLKVGEASFKGVIDRIDEVKTASGTAWELIDYKTGTPPKEGKLTFDQKEQLFIYQIAAEEVFQKPVGSLVLYFLGSQEQFSFLGSEKELDKVRTIIRETIDQITSSHFEATPGFWCKNCDFKFICPAAQRT